MQFLCSKAFLFNWSMFINYFEYIYLEVTYSKLAKDEIADIIAECRIV